MDDHDTILNMISELTAQLSALTSELKTANANIEKNQLDIKLLREELTAVKKYEWGITENPPRVTDFC